MKKTLTVLAAVLAACAACAAAPAKSSNAIARLLNARASGSPRSYAEAAETVAKEAAEGRPLQQFVIALVADEASAPAAARLAPEVRRQYLDRARDKIRALAEKKGNALAWYLLSLENKDLQMLRRAADGGNVQALNAYGTITLTQALTDPGASEEAREKAVAQGLRATVHHQRMEDLALPRRFRSVYLAGATFNLLPDDATAAAALASITRHLLPGGAALVPLWAPPPTPAEQIGRVREAVTEQGRRARFHVVGEEYDAAARTRTTRVHYRLDGPEGVQEADRDWVMHWYTDDGFRQLAEDAGLTVERVDVPADDERVVLLRRAAS